MIDSQERKIDYLRLSVTDRCNLRCHYCMPEEGVSKLDHSQILSDQEILRLVRLLTSMGVVRVRITGGEPLIRHNILELLQELAGLGGIEDLSMTTNGILLASMAGKLKSSGLARVNVSLDTFNADTYSSITRGGDLNSALSGVEAALEAGLEPVKINVVVMEGVNDQEIPAFVELARTRPLHVRFIEHMPVIQRDIRPGSGRLRNSILNLLQSPEPFTELTGQGPARVLREAGMVGSIGIIDPVSQHFCGSCNRIRLHSNGDLSYCLFSSRFINLRDMMRSGLSDDEISGRIQDFVDEKPYTHSGEFTRTRPMSSVGG